MDGKEDFGGVGGGSAPAEKLEAGEVEIKVGTVPSAFMPVPLPSGRHKRWAKEADSVSGLMLRPCSGSRAAAEEGKMADLVYGGLSPCDSGRTLTGGEAKADSDSVSGGLNACSGILAEKESKEMGAVVAVKSKGAAAGGSPEGGKPAAAAAAEDARAVDDGEEDSEVKWVEMPLDHIHWILAQKRENNTVPPIEDYDLYRSEEDAKSTVFSQKSIDETRELFTRLHASLQASHDDFFEYQAWVREVYESNGRVLIPEACSKDELQKEINDAWAQFKEEYARDHPDDSDTDSEV
nr:unnamed protein product [Digitaria exilis]